ncbi:MAG: penicillin-binding protein activator [Deltaproteobacteria bacterium]|nr:penicillin-binding protein activator [Deltaproteobacteria bacterium]
MKNNLPKSSVIILIVLLFSAISAVAGPTAVNSAQVATDKAKAAAGPLVAETSADRTDPQPLGCILPLTGRFAAYGNRVLEAIILAAGLFDPHKQSPVKLLIEDSESRPEKVREAVFKLVNAGAVAIIGPLGSDESEVAAPEAQRWKIPLLTLTQKEGITDAGPYVFRNFLSGSLQVKTLVKFAMGDLQLRKFAVLYPDDGHAPEIVKLFYQEVTRRKGSIVWAEPYKNDQTNFSEQIRKLVGTMEITRAGDEVADQPPSKTINFEALFIPDSYPAVKMIVPQLVYNDIRGVRLLGLNGWNSRELLAMEDGYLEGAIFTDGFFVESSYPGVIDFVDKFYAAYGREPDVMEAQVFDTAGMAVSNILENKGATREKFRDGLQGIRAYPGVTGRTSFSATREAEKDAFVLTVKDGKIIQVKQGDK